MQHAMPDGPETGIGPGLSVVAEPVDAATAERIAREHYGLSGTATWLAGEKDSNFRLTDGSGAHLFLKVLSPGEDPAVSSLHTQALIHVGGTAPDLPLPCIVRSRDGAPDLRIALAPGDLRTVRVTTFRPGRSQAAGPRTDAQRRAAGALLARLQGAFAGFSHPAADHETSWDLRRAGRLRAVLDVFPDPGRRARLAQILDALEARIVPALPTLPAQVVHNDFGGDNILVDPVDPDRITGVIDFGDMVRTARLFDVAIAAAYQLGTDGDPLPPAITFLRGYASDTSLAAAEVALLPAAIRTRMAMRLLIPEWRALRFPERRAYLTRNSAGVWRQFEHLDAMAPGAFDAAITAACHPGSAS